MVHKDMIANIIDRRTDKYNVVCDAVFEPSWHDNYASLSGTLFPEDDTFMVDFLTEVDITSAIWYAENKWPKVPTTMYLYDEGTNVRDGE